MIGRDALLELFDYTTFTWESYRRALARLPADALLRPVPGSEWPALRDVLLHLAVAWDDWLRDRLGLDAPLVATAGQVASWDTLAPVRERAREWLRRVIEQSSDSELRAEVGVEGTPPEMRITLAEVLAHILLHERGHHGDVSTLLSQLGTAPPSIDYLTYVYFRQRKADPGARGSRDGPS